MNEIIREALVGAVHEVAASSSRDVFANFISVIKKVREEMVLTYMDDKYVKMYVWPLLRNDINLTKALLNATANFTMAIPNLPEAINTFSNKAICFTSKTVIVDDDLLGKTISQSELKTTLENNHWLFFILFASTQIYLVNQVGVMYAVQNNA